MTWAAADRPYAETLAQLRGLSRLGMRLDLAAIEAVLARLGNPHHRVPVLHIAGTNGKGSTAAMAAACLSAQGYRTGRYTSPHLQRLTERIVIDGEEISRAALVAGYQAVGAAGGEPTFFEALTAVALRHFAAAKVDLAVVEVGLGGRLDATNVVLPRLTVITDIARDHSEILGHQLRDIAREKAGIIKRGVPVVSATSDRDLVAVIAAEARRQDAPLYLLGRDFALHAAAGGEGQTGVLTYRGIRRQVAGIRLRLGGAHQQRNAALAVAALELLGDRGFGVSDAAIRAGLFELSWPGRLEQVGDVLLDVAHNPAAIAALVATLPERDYCVLFGALSDKPAAMMLTALRAVARRIIATAPSVVRALDPCALRDAAGDDIEVILPAAAACNVLLNDPGPKLVTGSAYLVGEVRGYLLDEPCDPLSVADPRGPAVPTR